MKEKEFKEVKIVVVSFEISPMQNQMKSQSQKKIIDQFYELKPDYISCSINGIKDVDFKRNFELCKTLKADNLTIPMTNFSIGGKKKEELFDRLNAYLSIGIDHFFVLRGDFQCQKQELSTQSFSFIETIKTEKSDAIVAVAGYPETHISAASEKSDLKHLKIKQAFGADQITTQICYDVNAMEIWLENCQKKGIHLPVEVGVLPVINRNRILQVCILNGISIPRELSKIIGRYDNDTLDFKKAGIEFTIKHIESLKKLGIKDFHFFSGNNVKIISEILFASRLRKIK